MHSSHLRKTLISLLAILSLASMYQVPTVSANSNYRLEHSIISLGRRTLWRSTPSYNCIYTRSDVATHSWKVVRILYVDHLLGCHTHRHHTTVPKAVLYKARRLIRAYEGTDDPQLATHVWHQFIKAYGRRYHISPHHLYKAVYSYNKRAYIRQTQYDMKHNIDKRLLRRHPSRRMRRALYKSIRLTKRIGRKNIHYMRKLNPWSMHGQMLIRKAESRGPIVVRPINSRTLLARDVHCNDITHIIRM